jgi:plastocyanin
MKMSSWRFVLVVITAVSLIGFPKAASATTFDVTIAPNGELVFSPSSVTIHPGDQVKWTWGSSGHSTSSGSPGQPNGIWDSGLCPQGVMFTHTFNSTGTFPYYCTPTDSQWLAGSAWTDYECIFPVWHHDQLRVRDPYAESDWEHLPQHHHEHQRLNPTHSLPFPDGSHERLRHQNGRRQDLYNPVAQ